MGATKPYQVESNVDALKIAAEWTEEKEEKMNKILDNEPTPRLDWTTWSPYPGRRGESVTYSLPLGKLEREIKLCKRR